MGRERADAWRELPPFDRLHKDFVARSEWVFDPEPRPDDVPIYVNVEGTRVTLRITADRERHEFQFRYRRSHKAWQLFGREGSRWVAGGPPSPTTGALLERLMVGLLIADRTAVRR